MVDCFSLKISGSIKASMFCHVISPAQIQFRYENVWDSVGVHCGIQCTCISGMVVHGMHPGKNGEQFKGINSLELPLKPKPQE